MIINENSKICLIVLYNRFQSIICQRSLSLFSCLTMVFGLSFFFPSDGLVGHLVVPVCTPWLCSRFMNSIGPFSCVLPHFAWHLQMDSKINYILCKRFKCSNMQNSKLPESSKQSTIPNCIILGITRSGVEPMTIYNQNWVKCSREFYCMLHNVESCVYGK